MSHQSSFYLFRLGVGYIKFYILECKLQFYHDTLRPGRQRGMNANEISPLGHVTPHPPMRGQCPMRESMGTGAVWLSWSR